MAFDVEGAKAAGHSEYDINVYLTAKQRDFNIQGALDSNFSIQQIGEHLGVLNEPVLPAAPVKAPTLETKPFMQDIAGNLTRPFRAIKEITQGAWKGGMAEFTQGLADVGKSIERANNLPESTLFPKLAEEYASQAEHYNKRAEKIGATVIDEIIGSALGGAFPGVVGFAFDVAGFAALKGFARGGTKQAIEDQVRVWMLGGVLKTAHALTAPLKTQVFGATFAADDFGQQLASGQPIDWASLGKSYGVGNLFALTGKPGRAGIKEIKQPFQEAKYGKDMVKLAALRDKALKAQKELTETEFKASVAEPKVAEGKPTEPLITNIKGIDDTFGLNTQTIKAMVEAYKKGDPVILGRPIAVRKTKEGFTVIEGLHRAVAAKKAGVEPPIVVLTEKEVSGLSAPEVDVLAKQKIKAEKPVEKVEPEFKLATEEGRTVEGREPKQTADLFTEKGFEEKLTPEEVRSQTEETVERLEGEQTLPLEEVKILRTGKPMHQQKFNPEKHSLKDFIAIKGGLNKGKEQGGGLTGELDKIRETKSGAFLVNKNSGLSMDDMRMQAIEAGFLNEWAGPNKFLDAIEQDLTATSRLKRVWSNLKDIDAEITKAAEQPNIDMMGLSTTYDEAVKEIADFMDKKMGYLKRRPGDFKSEDMRNFIINEYLQTPSDIARTFPDMQGIIDALDKRILARNELQSNYYDATASYWTMPEKARRRIGKVLFKGDRVRTVYNENQLRKQGLNDVEIAGYNSIRRALDITRDRIVNRMRESNVPEGDIQEFIGNRTGYFPHKRYGEYGVGAFRKGEKTPLYLETFEGGIKGPGVLKARIAREKLRRRYKDPNIEVKVIKLGELPDAYFDDVPSSQNFDLLLSKLREGAQGEKNILSAVEELSNIHKNNRLSRGFGRHFIERKNIPGYSKDADRVLADYFNGYAGYETKYSAAIEMWRGLGKINAKQKPNLYKYASDYVHYQLENRSPEYNRIRSGLFYWYLGMNVKSAFVNATQNWITASPLLTQYSGKSGFVQVGKASKDMVTNNFTESEIAAIAMAKKDGIVSDLLTAELSGTKQGLFYAHIKGKSAKVARAMFSGVEKYNRTSTFLAFFRAAEKKGLDFDSAFQVARQGVKDSHFFYGKGDRPRAGRGRLAPLMTFRMFTINYAQFLKNRLKGGEYAAFLKSIGMMAAFAGTTGIPGFKAADYLYGKATGDDLEGDIRQSISDFASSVLGEEHSDKSQFVERLITRGVPAAVVGIDMSGSIGMGDIIPGVSDQDGIGATIADIVGVLGDFPRKGKNAVRDLKTGQYLRAIEDVFAPEFIRNPMSAIRMYREGLVTRGGVQMRNPYGEIIKPSLTDTIKKSLGFQPIEATERFKAYSIVERKAKFRQALKRQYLDAMMVAMSKSDNDQFNEIKADLRANNDGKDLEDRIIITGQDIASRVMGFRASMQSIPHQQNIHDLFLKKEDGR